MVKSLLSFQLFEIKVYINLIYYSLRKNLFSIILSNMKKFNKLKHIVERVNCN